MARNVNGIMIKRLSAAMICMVLAVSIGQAQISVVVAESSRQTAGASEIKQIFTGAKLVWAGGEKVLVADQPESAISKAFYEKFVGKSVSQVRTEWMKLVLSGQATAPKKCAGDAAVKEFLSDNPNAVGYISSSALDERVKEIHRVSAAGKGE